MSSGLQSTASTFTASARERIAHYLAARHETDGAGITALTPDASSREYFRIPWRKSTAVAAVYPEPFDASVHPYLDVTRLFVDCGLPVPQVLDVDGDAGIIVQEDLGSRQLCQVFEEVSDDERETLLEQAIEIIARIQAATPKAFERDSIASRLAFDEAKLSWELNFFFEHYFGSYRKEELTHGQSAELKAELNDLAADLAAVPRVLCHRDYHTANLMLGKAGNV